MKKFTRILVTALILMLVLPQAVMAADVLEVDTASPMFKADTWQNSEGSDEVCPLSKVFDVTPMPPSGTPNTEVSRYSGCVNVRQDNLEGEQVFINGSATTSVIFPFKETVNLESITWKWNNGTRQYFFFAYISMDGENWTEIDFNSSNIRRGNCDVTYDEDGDLSGPAISNIWISSPAGSGADDDVLPITFTFAPSGATNYLKFLFYGNDGGQEVDEVTHPWISFNSLKITGTAAAAEAPAAVEEAPAGGGDAPEAPAVPAPAPAPAPAPSAPTGDAGITALIALFAIAAAGMVVLRKKAR